MSENPGAKWMFPVAVPVPGDVVVTVMNVGPLVFENVSALPFGSVADRAWSAVAPSLTVMFEGCARTGGKLGVITVIAKDLSLVSVPLLARTVPANVPF